MDRNITKREEVAKGDMSRVGEGDGFENIERCAWLSFVVQVMDETDAF